MLIIIIPIYKPSEPTSRLTNDSKVQQKQGLYIKVLYFWRSLTASLQRNKFLKWIKTTSKTNHDDHYTSLQVSWWRFLHRIGSAFWILFGKLNGTDPDMMEQRIKASVGNKISGFSLHQRGTIGIYCIINYSIFSRSFKFSISPVRLNFVSKNTLGISSFLSSKTRNKNPCFRFNAHGSTHHL